LFFSLAFSQQAALSTLADTSKLRVFPPRIRSYPSRVGVPRREFGRRESFALSVASDSARWSRSPTHG
jgi:hypothetical protein